MAVFKDDGYTMQHTEEFKKKRRFTFAFLAVLQLLCPVAIVVTYFLHCAFLVAFITAPLFIVFHITYIKGIVSLEDEGESSKKYKALRILLLIIYIIAFIFGMATSTM